MLESVFGLTRVGKTITVLRQAWQDRLRPILLINKFDRLITELKLSPTEAYHHLSRLIEQVNAVMGSFFASERMEDDLRWREERERRREGRPGAYHCLRHARSRHICNQAVPRSSGPADDLWPPRRGGIRMPWRWPLR